MSGGVATRARAWLACRIAPAVRIARRPGPAFVHSPVDGFSRLADSEVLPDEQAITAAAFWRRADAFFAELGIVVERVLTDNGGCYRSGELARALGPVQHSFTRPYRPQTNDKVERLHRPLLADVPYATTWPSEG